MVDDRHAVADLLDLAQQVRVEEHRGTPSRGASHDAPNVDAADGVEGRGRLIEDDERRLAEQGDAQPESLLHALGEAPDEVTIPSASSAALPRRERGMPISSPCSVITSRALSQGWYRNSSGR